MGELQQIMHRRVNSELDGWFILIHPIVSSLYPDCTTSLAGWGPLFRLGNLLEVPHLSGEGPSVGFLSKAVFNFSNWSKMAS